MEEEEELDITKLHRSQQARAYLIARVIHQMRRRFASLLQSIRNITLLVY